MKINKDSDSFARASEKSYRLLPKMFKPRVVVRFGAAVVVQSVVGSRGFVYTVKIWNDQISSFNSVCDCAAGKSDVCCYHVASVYLEYQLLKKQQQLWNLNLLPTVVSSAYAH